MALGQSGAQSVEGLGGSQSFTKQTTSSWDISENVTQAKLYVSQVPSLIPWCFLKLLHYRSSCFQIQTDPSTLIMARFCTRYHPKQISNRLHGSKWQMRTGQNWVEPRTNCNLSAIVGSPWWLLTMSAHTWCGHASFSTHTVIVCICL